MLFDVFFFKQKTAYDLRISDWSSDVCSSDLTVKALLAASAATVKDPKGTAAAIQGKFFAKVKPEVVEAAVKDMTDGIANPRFTAADIANVKIGRAHV